ncbi:MAG: hypothetical protein V3T31_05730 [candidate division Zixibacteria bacterium]
MTVEVEIEIVSFVEPEDYSRDEANSESFCICKFMLLETNSQPTMIYGPIKHYGYHAELLNRYCNERKLATSWNRMPESLEIYEQSVRLRGGGWLEIRPDQKLVRIWGGSTVYGKFSEALICEAQTSDAFFPGFEFVAER